MARLSSCSRYATSSHSPGASPWSMSSEASPRAVGYAHVSEADMIEQCREEVALRHDVAIAAAGVDHARMAEDQGDPERAVADVGRDRHVRMPPQPMVSKRIRLVGREDHERVPVEPPFCEGVHDSPDSEVHQGVLGGEIGQALLIVVHEQALPDPVALFLFAALPRWLVRLAVRPAYQRRHGRIQGREHRVRAGGAFGVERVSRVRAGVGRRQRVRTVQVELQEERSAAVDGRQVVQRLVTEVVDHVPVCHRASLTVLEDDVVVEVLGVTHRQRDPVFKADLRLPRLPQMPLADHRRLIATIPQRQR